MNTSQAAYESLDPSKATALREKVFDLIKNSDGLTDEEIQTKLRIPGNTQRPRRWELSHKQGRIRQSGTRETKTGRQAAVWVASTNPKAPEQKVRSKRVVVSHVRDGRIFGGFVSFLHDHGSHQIITIPIDMTVKEGDRLIIK